MRRASCSDNWFLKNKCTGARFTHDHMQSTSKQAGVHPKLCFLRANSPLNEAATSNQDTLTGPKGGRIRESPLYYDVAVNPQYMPHSYFAIVSGQK